MPEEPSVRFGVLLSTNRRPAEGEADVFDRTLELARVAEEKGVDDLWVVEHHFQDATPCPSALSVAAFLLGRTRRPRVGTAVTLLPLHPPLHVAEQAALLDHLSGGRFVLGVGRGQPAPEYEAVGRGSRYWKEGLAEALDLVRSAWRGPVSADSALYSFPEVTTVPGPRSPQGPPVYVAAGSVATAELAGSRGLPLLTYFDKTAEHKADLVRAHADAAQSAGHRAAGYDHAFAAYTEVTDTAAEARAVMRERAASILRSTRAAHDPETLTDRLLAMHPVGSPETCVRNLVRDITTSGCTRVLCQVEGTGTTAGAVRNLKRLTDEVFPEVRRRVAVAGPAVARPAVAGPVTAGPAVAGPVTTASA